MASTSLIVVALGAYSILSLFHCEQLLLSSQSDRSTLAYRFCTFSVTCLQISVCAIYAAESGQKYVNNDEANPSNYNKFNIFCMRFLTLISIGLVSYLVVIIGQTTINTAYLAKKKESPRLIIRAWQCVVCVHVAALVLIEMLSHLVSGLAEGSGAMAIDAFMLYVYSLSLITTFAFILINLGLRVGLARVIHQISFQVAGKVQLSERSPTAPVHSDARGMFFSSPSGSKQNVQPLQLRQLKSVSNTESSSHHQKKMSRGWARSMLALQTEQKRSDWMMLSLGIVGVFLCVRIYLVCVSLQQNSSRADSFFSLPFESNASFSLHFGTFLSVLVACTNWLWVPCSHNKISDPLYQKIMCPCAQRILDTYTLSSGTTQSPGTTPLPKHVLQAHLASVGKTPTSKPSKPLKTGSAAASPVLPALNGETLSFPTTSSKSPDSAQNRQNTQNTQNSQKNRSKTSSNAGAGVRSLNKPNASKNKNTTPGSSRSPNSPAVLETNSHPDARHSPNTPDTPDTPNAPATSQKTRNTHNASNITKSSNSQKNGLKAASNASNASNVSNASNTSNISNTSKPGQSASPPPGSDTGNSPHSSPSPASTPPAPTNLDGTAASPNIISHAQSNSGTISLNAPVAIAPPPHRNRSRRNNNFNNTSLTATATATSLSIDVSAPPASTAPLGTGSESPRFRTHPSHASHTSHPSRRGHRGQQQRPSFTTSSPRGRDTPHAPPSFVNASSNTIRRKLGSTLKLDYDTNLHSNTSNPNARRELTATFANYGMKQDHEHLEPSRDLTQSTMHFSSAIPALDMIADSDDEEGEVVHLENLDHVGVHPDHADHADRNGMAAIAEENENTNNSAQMGQVGINDLDAVRGTHGIVLHWEDSHDMQQMQLEAHEIEMYLEDVTMSGKKIGKYGRLKVPKVDNKKIGSKKTRDLIAKLNELNLIDQKIRNDKHTHLERIKDRTEPYAKRLSGLNMNLEEKNDLSRPDRRISNISENIANMPSLPRATSGSRSESEEESASVGDGSGGVSLVIFELDHVLCTMPESLNKLDFNHWESIEIESLLLAFGGEERVQNLEKHLRRVVEHNEKVICFVFTQRHSVAVQRVLQAIGLSGFFEHCTYSGAVISHVIGWDHKLMQETEFRSHLILLKLIMFLRRDHDNVLYIGKNDHVIEHLRNIQACQTYHVKTKGLLQTDLDAIEKKHFNPGRMWQRV